MLTDLHNWTQNRHLLSVGTPLMNRLALSAVILAILTCEAPSSWAGQEEDAIEKTIKAAATGAATYSDTRDKQAILRHYAKDYVGIQDGEAETVQVIEKWLSEYDEELKRGSRVYYVANVSEVKIHVTGSLAWATYDYVFQMVRNGELQGEDVGKCTSLLRKEGSDWLIFHEHCSRQRANR
jgi:ketosteroid isomerase-like protein